MKRFFRVVDLSTESVSSRAKTAKKIREVQVSMPVSTRPRFVGATGPRRPGLAPLAAGGWSASPLGLTPAR